MRRLQGVLVAFLFLPPAAARAVENRAVEYSADSVYHGDKGQITINKVFVSSGKVRIEPPDGKSYEILDPAHHFGWFFISAKDKKKTLMFDPIAEAHAARYGVGPSLCTHLPLATCKKLGTETVNGHVAEKWYFSRPGRGKTVVVKTIWVDRSLDAIVRVAGDGGKLNYELLNVRLGPQPAGKFADALPPQSVVDKLHQHHKK